MAIPPLLSIAGNTLAPLARDVVEQQVERRRRLALSGQRPVDGAAELRAAPGADQASDPGPRGSGLDRRHRSRVVDLGPQLMRRPEYWQPSETH